jgi:arylsulfatase A-like enzyme
MCDEQLGKVLDLMDELDLWKDTMLIVNTDHGFHLGEHDWWAKCCQPFYNEVAHIPFFVWDPRSGKRGERRSALVQTIDICPTLLDYFGLKLSPDMQGKPLRETISSDAPVREAGLFGLFGAHINVTDGRYVYMRAPVSPDAEVYQYTLALGQMKNRENPDEVRRAQLAPPFSFSKGCPLLKFPRKPWVNAHQFGNLLFDLETDPGQGNPLHDEKIEAMMIEKMVGLMKWNDAPEEQFTRVGLD